MPAGGMQLLSSFAWLWCAAPESGYSSLGGAWKGSGRGQLLTGEVGKPGPPLPLRSLRACAWPWCAPESGIRTPESGIRNPDTAASAAACCTGAGRA
eukprot:250796-Chlamydomonas_euryale.AAC.1